MDRALERALPSAWKTTLDDDDMQPASVKWGRLSCLVASGCLQTARVSERLADSCKRRRCHPGIWNGYFAPRVARRYDGNMQMEFTAVFRPVPEGFVAFVEELPGANTQGATLAEARANLEEAVRLVLEANRALSQEDLLGADVIREPFKLTA
jgi:predicted RNase H-like HicB family nuclease